MSTFVYNDTYLGFDVSWTSQYDLIPDFGITPDFSVWRTIGTGSSDPFQTQALTLTSSDGKAFNFDGLDVFSTFDATESTVAILNVSGVYKHGGSFSDLLQTKITPGADQWTWGPDFVAADYNNLSSLTLTVVPSQGPITGPGNSFWTVTLDGIDVAAVPLPAGGVLLVVALAALFGLRAKTHSA